MGFTKLNMEREGKFTKEMRLFSDLDAPARFSVQVFESSKDAEKVFEVTGLDAHQNTLNSSHILTEISPHGYFNLFQKLAEDFDLHLPFNRQLQPDGNVAEITFNVLLKENLSPEMVYGYAEPAVTKVSDLYGYKSAYYLLVSSFDAPDAFPILFSQDLISWTFQGFVFPQGKHPLWAVSSGLGAEFRSPEIHLIGMEFRLYFVARDQLSRQLCIGMAKSLFPDGPYVADQQPILGQNVVDPHVFVYDQGTVYLFWKEDNNAVWPGLLARLIYNHPSFIELLFDGVTARNTASFTTTLWPWIQTLDTKEHSMALQSLTDCVTSTFYTFYQKLLNLSRSEDEPLKDAIYTILAFMRTPIYGQQLSPDGSTLIREKIKVIENDQDWEAHVVEGVWITRHEGEYFLFYTGNEVASNLYGIGLAVAKAPLGPYVKHKQPIINAGQANWLAGHPCIVEAPDGSSRLIMHGYYPEHGEYRQFQVLLSVPIRFSNKKVRLG
jgi:arabinan endo-1,5-alpha-L-arabinosidase